MKSFAPDELSFHTAHQPCTAILQLHTDEGLSLQETEIIEQYLSKSNALRAFFTFFHRRPDWPVADLLIQLLTRHKTTLSVRQTGATSGTLAGIAVSILTIDGDVIGLCLV
jgi:hypothetical protein